MSSQTPTIFNHEAFGEIRAITKDGDPWFIAKDVAKSLGYVNHRDAVSRHCTGQKKTPIHLSGSRFATLTDVTLIPEGDVFALIFGSKLPELETFKQWVFNEVLPSIRKTGKFDIKPPSHLETARELVIALERTEALTAQIISDRPKVVFAETVERDGDSWTMKNTADLLGLGRNKLFQALRDLGIMQPDKTTVYRQYIDRGYFETIEALKGGRTFVQTLTTAKGRIWLAGKLEGLS